MHQIHTATQLYHHHQHQLLPLDASRSPMSKSPADPIDNLWSQAFALQTQMASSHSSNAEALRTQLMHTLGDIVLLSIDAFATRSSLRQLRNSVAAKNVDDLIWNLVFRKKIDELRANVAQADPSLIPAATKSLLAFVSSAASFYRSHVQSVSVYCQPFGGISSIAEALYFGHQRCTEKWASKDDIEFARLVQRVLCKSIVYLGDLERYRATNTRESNTDDKWTNVNFIYEYAMRIDPDQGKPQSQLGIIATLNKNYLDALYWYSLSMSNTNPFDQAKPNLIPLHKKIAQLRPLSEEELASPTLGTLSTAMSHFHRLVLFHPDESSLLNLATNSDNPSHHQSQVFRVVDSLLANENTSTMEPSLPPPPRIPILAITRAMTKIVIILISSYTSLNAVFAETTAPQVRQRVRDLQCIALGSLFRICGACLGRILEESRVGRDVGGSGGDSETETELEVVAKGSLSDDSQVESLLAPVGVLCAWLFSSLKGSEVRTDSGVAVVEQLAASSSAPLRQQLQPKISGGQQLQLQQQRSSGGAALGMDAFSLFLKYTTGNGISEAMKQQSNHLFNFSRALASLSNTLVAFADEEGDPHVLPEDLPLLGFSPLKPYYVATLDPSNLRRALEKGTANLSDDSNTNDAFLARSSRVLGLAKRLSERKELDFFVLEKPTSYNVEGGVNHNNINSQYVFAVRDEESKRLARLANARTMGLKHLQEKVKNLEITALPRKTVTYIPDVGVYTRYLGLIKSLLIPRGGQKLGGAHPSPIPDTQIVVPADLVHQLDVLKKDDPRAREVTRYLLQRLSSPSSSASDFASASFVPQKPSETVRNVTYTHVTDDDEFIEPPREFKSFIGCALFFTRQSVAVEVSRREKCRELGVRDEPEEDGRNDADELNGLAWVITDDADLAKECRRCGVSVLSVNQLKRRVNEIRM